MQDLPASGSRKARTNTHQGLVTQSCRALSLHITQTPVLFRTTIFVHFYNCNFYLISLSYLVADTSARSKQRILKTFAKLAEKADRQPVCTELKQKTILMFLQMSCNCTCSANFKNIRKNRSKVLCIVLLQALSSRGNNDFCNLLLSNNAC